MIKQKYSEINFLFQNLPQGKNNWLFVERRHIFDDFFSENTTCEKKNYEINDIQFSDQHSTRISLQSNFEELDVVRILYEKQFDTFLNGKKKRFG